MLGGCDRMSKFIVLESVIFIQKENVRITALELLRQSDLPPPKLENQIFYTLNYVNRIYYPLNSIRSRFILRGVHVAVN